MSNGEGASARVHALAAGQYGVVSAAQLRELGTSEAFVRRIVRSGRWQVVHRGSYWITAKGSPPVATRAQSALFACGPKVAVAGPMAARLHGIAGSPPDNGTTQLIGPRPLERSGLVMRKRMGQHVTTVGGLAVTTPAQTVADLLLTLPREYAVSLLDSALQQRMLPGKTAEVTPLLKNRIGAERARLLMREADGRAESPLETRHRLLCHDAGLPPEVLQWPLEDPDSKRWFRIDAGWPSRMVGVEADGKEVHGRPRALYEDRHRQNALLAAYPQLALLRFTWEDARQPREFLRRLRQVLDRTL